METGEKVEISLSKQDIPAVFLGQALENALLPLPEIRAFDPGKIDIDMRRLKIKILNREICVCTLLATSSICAKSSAEMEKNMIAYRQQYGSVNPAGDYYSGNCGDVYQYVDDDDVL